MNNIPLNISDVPLRDDSRIQILEELDDLRRARKHQYAAFIRKDHSLLVWADAASRVIDDAMDIEKKIIELIWGDGDSVRRYEKVVAEHNDELELEKGYVPPKRGRVLLQPLLVGGALIIIFLFVGGGLKILLREIAITGGWSHLTFLLTSPILFFAMVSSCQYDTNSSSLPLSWSAAVCTYSAHRVRYLATQRFSPAAHLNVGLQGNFRTLQYNVLSIENPSPESSIQQSNPSKSPSQLTNSRVVRPPSL